MADLLSVRLVPSIALDYEARGVFPVARLLERPGRVPAARNVGVPRETATAMLADARARPEQLKREQSNFKGGAVTAWHKLMADLEWALLTDEERSEREEEMEARRRGRQWLNELEDGYGWNHPTRVIVRQLTDANPEEQARMVERMHAFAAEKDFDRNAMSLVGIVLIAHEAELERRLDVATLRAAKAAIERVSRA